MIFSETIGFDKKDEKRTIDTKEFWDNMNPLEKSHFWNNDFQKYENNWKQYIQNNHNVTCYIEVLVQ
jgi:hypothetical protein